MVSICEILASATRTFSKTSSRSAIVSVISAWSGLGLSCADCLRFRARPRMRVSGRSQIVRDVIGGLLDFSHQHLDAIEHGIEIFRH